THAHVGSDHGHSHVSDVHGGHSHDLGRDGDVDDSPEQIVVDMKPALTSQGNFQSVFWAYWVPLTCTLVLLLAVAQLCLLLVAPHRSDPRLLTRDGHWRPPLRGPPAFSIQA